MAKENRKRIFKVNEDVIYPTHGVGKVTAVEKNEFDGETLELYVVYFEKDKMTLRVPTNKAEQTGMRGLSDQATLDYALKILQGRPRVKRAMWSRRAQEYDQKINSGDLVAIAEVVRDLHRNDEQREQSYSERQLYEAALERMMREIAVTLYKGDEATATTAIEDILNSRKAPQS